MSIWKEKNPSRKVVPGSSRCPRSHLEVVMALNNHQFLMFMTLEVKSSGRAQWGCLTGNWSSTRWLDVALFGILFWLWAVSPGSFHGLLAGAGRFRRLLHSHVCAVAGLGAVDPFLLSPSSSVWLLGLPQSVVISSQGDWPLPQ